MGTYVIRMPDIGEGIAEVELVAWHVKPGDVVADEQVLADVMTDKANVEIPSHVAGKVVSIAGKGNVGDDAPAPQPVAARPGKAARTPEAPAPRAAAAPASSAQAPAGAA